MTDVTIRQLRNDELFDAYQSLLWYAFEPSPPLHTFKDDRQEQFITNRRDATSFVVFEGDRPVTHAADLPMQLNVRDQVYPACGVWGVSSHPSARRKGYVRRAMMEMFEAARKRNMPFSTLYPFRESFYERLGYITYPQPRKYRFQPDALAPLLKLKLHGEVEMMAIQDGADLWRGYMRKRLVRVHGMGMGNDRWPFCWILDDNRAWLAVARIDGEPRAMMLYSLQGKQDNFTIDIGDFFYDDIWGRTLLLEWVARHIDHVSHIVLRLPPFELPETWLSDLNVKPEFEFPGMGRVLDIAGIGGMSTGPGAFTARVTDPHCPWNAGVYRFETVDGALQVSQADTTPDCELTIQALSALVFGTHEPALFELRGWGAPSADLQATMRTMFPPMLPFLHERF